ncbi:hypothetical protein SFUMM280S_05968 [Streptomyces fumanus]
MIALLRISHFLQNKQSFLSRCHWIIGRLFGNFYSLDLRLIRLINCKGERF